VHDRVVSNDKACRKNIFLKFNFFANIFFHEQKIENNVKILIKILYSLIKTPYFVSTITPLLLSLIAPVIAFYEQQELYIIFISFIFSFLIISVTISHIFSSLNSFDDWIEKRKIEDNIYIDNIFPEIFVTNENLIRDSRFCIVLHNRSRYFISYKIENIVVSANNFLPKNPIYENYGTVIAPNSNVIFNFALISLQNPSRHVDGEIGFDLKYGVPNKVIYGKKFKAKTSYFIDANGKPYFNWRIIDVDTEK